ncbi:MAG: hypothetical protein AB3N09_09710, partial [Tateyamaria sp.]
MSATRHILDWFAAVDPRIWQAVIAGLFVAIGWIVNGAQNRRDAARLRREQREDVQRALGAEIKHYLEGVGVLWGGEEGQGGGVDGGGHCPPGGVGAPPLGEVGVWLVLGTRGELRVRGWFPPKTCRIPPVLRAIDDPADGHEQASNDGLP